MVSSKSAGAGGASSAGIGIFFALLVAQPASAQLGHVVDHQKISATAGGFTAQLEEMDQFGRSIVNLGDLDGDGVTDLLVGAHTDDDGGLDKGSVYVVFLHSNGFVKSWQKISDLEGNFTGQLRRGDQFGRAAANLGDLDGDGVVDVAVSANYDDDGGTNMGAVYVLFLNTDGTVKRSQKISMLQGGLPAQLHTHDEFGRSITCLGDLDRDGVADMLVGTPEDDEGGTNTGALHVLFLNADGTVKAYRRISKSTDGLAIKPTDWFGFCSANLGDFDGDGVVDVAVGAVLDDDGGVNQGSVWILFLNPDGSVKAKREIDELESGFTAQLDDIDQFGTSVANIGDLDGDGVTDIAVGAVKDDDGGEPGNPDADVGAVYVLFLNEDASVKEWVKLSDLYGEVPFALDQWDWFGSALAPLGGSPGDGLFNVAIGCRNDDDAGGNMGAIYLVRLNDGTVPVADFTAGRTLGVAPLTVAFTDQSIGDLTAWLWSFGDGGAQSNQPAPSRTYTQPGTYDVQLVVRGPRGNDTEIKREFITVVEGPLAWFDATPRNGGCPLAVAFTDSSEGDVTSWHWDFGDGQTSTERSPAHVYGCGTYDVTLTVIGPKGSHARTEPGYVVAALQAPVAAFGAAPASGPGPLDVQFTDASLGQVTSWSWDFGDGQASSEPSPLHRYDAPGTYTVALAVSGPGGSDTETRPTVTVTEPPPTAYFEAEPTVGPVPLGVAFADLTTGAVTAWSWDFGDGGTATGRAPVHVYTTPGLYSVTLTATGPGGSHARTRPDLVTVESVVPEAAFGAAPTAGPAPLAVQFTDESLYSTSWTWDFGDGATASTRHPLHVYAAPGVYSVTLSVTGPGGNDVLRRDELISVTVPPTTASFTAEPVEGAAPLAVAFRDASSANVTAWAWSFGDGGSSSERSPAHVYSAPGRYDVTLSVTSATGADALTRAGCVTVHDPVPQAQFVAVPATGLPPLAVQFDDQSSGAVTAWSWSFGDGATSTASEPLHVYTLPGVYAVSLTVSGPGGTNTLARTDAVRVLEPPPVAAFAAAPTSGVAPLSVQFTDATTGLATSWAWSFGDGTTSSVRSPAHVYSTPGTYTVTLSAKGPGGSDGETKTDLVAVAHPAPVAAFAATPTTGAPPLSVQFTDQSVGALSGWTWSFGDGTSSTARNPAHVYATAGSYTVTLTARGPGGTDDERKTDLVSVVAVVPTAAFSAAPTTGLAPLAVQFTDASTGTVTGWSWNFGDGATSTARNPAHTFATWGTYTVTLTARGPVGTDAEIRTDLVRVDAPPPVADFGATPREGYAPLQVTFTDLSTGVVTTRLWDFGDGTVSDLVSPAHRFELPGTYAVTLTLTGPGGTSSRRRTVVADPIPVFGDGSFELQSPASPPRAPWTVYNGTSVIVRATTDLDFPGDGARWCDIGADGTSNARPPTNPGGAGGAPTGTAGIQQSFGFPVHAPNLELDVAFLLNGPLAGSRNDFMSVDLSDGVRFWNVFYADSYSAFPRVSKLHGLRTTDTTRVRVDLRALFPAADEYTVLTLRVGVGNVGGSPWPSRGYVDGIRFVPSAKAVYRNGTGENPSLFDAAPVVVGDDWQLAIDSSGHPGASTALVVGRTLALGGRKVRGGELLITGPRLFAFTLPLSGGVEHFALAVPDDPGLIGLEVHAQAALLGCGIVRTNAYDLRLGY